MTESREQARRRMLRNVKVGKRNVESLLADQDAWNAANPRETPIDVNSDGMLTLVLQWLDQHERELIDDVFPLSDPSPRLAKYLETLA